MTNLELQSQIKQNPFVLAPMAGITDCAFRSFMREMGCGVVITELISATGLKYSSQKTLKLMQFDPSQHPVGIQIFGDEMDHLVEAAQKVQDLGADFVDLNFGCPVPKVVNKGGGSAILKDLHQVQKVFSHMKKAVQIPVTVKIRTGWDANSINSVEVCHIAQNEGLAWVAIHGRTRAQGYSGRADWSYIKKVKEQSAIPIIGNGDISSPLVAVQRLKESKCDAVMIGRGCLKNPWIFQEAMELWQGNGEHKTIQVQKRDFIEAFNRLERHLTLHSEQRIVLLQLRKFAAWFSAGYPNASQLRKTIFTENSLEDLKSKIHDFFGPLSDMKPLDTSDEPFLMGGHG